MRENSKMARIFISGFIVISVITMTIFNIGLKNNLESKESDRELQVMSKIFQEARSTDLKIDQLDDQLKVLRQALNNSVNYSSVTTEEILNFTTYKSDENITLIDETNNLTTYGNLMIMGKKEELDGFVVKEINSMLFLFELQEVFRKNSDMDILFSYFSDSEFVAYYPYYEFNGSASSQFEATKNSIHKIIKDINDLPEKEYRELVDKGWRNILSENYIASLPVERNNKIIGFLQSKIKKDDFIKLEKINKYDKFIIDQNNNILFSSLEIDSNADFVDYVDKTYNGINYYKSKFPNDYEVRDEGNYKLYISSNLDKNYKLIYIEKKVRSVLISEIILNNAFVLIVIFGIIYLIIVNDNHHGNKLELVIKKSQYDGMTELLNREHIMEEFDKYKKNKRVKHVSLVMVDIDDFKDVNDNYGHAIGDEVIRLCAKCIRQATEKVNAFAGRYGGEEFLIVFPKLSENKAYEVAEEIRNKFSQQCKELLGIDITISMGLYYYEKPNDMSSKELIDQADKNLYKAKRNGKNQVIRDEQVTF